MRKQIVNGSVSIIQPQDSSAYTPAQQKALDHACLCARVADEYRGGDILVLDMTGVTPIVDFFVLTNGNSRRQMHAIADEVDRVLSEHGSERLGLEGYDGSSWLLQDYGDVVLHVFSPEARGIFDLEHLWADARRIDWRTASAPDESSS